MRDMDQLDENLRAMAEPYTDKDEKLLTGTLAQHQPLYCRMCGSCGGVCDKGVPVADMLRILTYADGYGEFAMARERFLELPAVAGASGAATASRARSTAPTASACATG